MQSELPTLLILNTTFTNITFLCNEKLIRLKGTILQLEGPVVFAHFHYQQYSLECWEMCLPGIVYVTDIYSMVICHNYIDFSNNRIAVFSFTTDYGDGNTNKFIVIKKNTFINLTNQMIVRFFTKKRMCSLTIGLKKTYNYLNNLPCYFQYISKRGNFDNKFTNGNDLKYSIEIDKKMSDYYLMTHCRWLPGTAFNTTRPIDVNKKFVKNFHLKSKGLCICLNDSKQDCYNDTSATVYPGQSITVMLLVNKTLDQLEKPLYFWHSENTIKENGTTVIIQMNDNEVPQTACKLVEAKEASQIIYSHCTIVNFTIVHSRLDYLKWCELFVKVKPNHIEGYYVNILSCPPGFCSIK